ncbi:cell division protein ZapA [Alkalicoccus chagannorensis]|uniref:cell division protein ZapA n=1 Tax=Alkalicoccus chagannorensis TaxID=427072 RepID=UPI00040A8969|nr:cell division protein ZapA [Alkalicoccus chagannorensis]
MAREEEKKKTIVTIGSHTYTVTGRESPGHVQQSAAYVDEKMKELRAKNPFLTSTQLAVLAALNISSEYHLLQDQINDTKEEEE